MKTPSGAAIRLMRLSEKEKREDGTVVVKTISAPGIIIRLKVIPNVKPSDVRRDFVRACRRLGCLEPIVVERGYGHYAKSGTAIEEGLPSAFQVMGEFPALLAASRLPQVESWEPALAIRVPTCAGGSGPEKVRPPSGTAFGKPATVKATAEAVAKATSEAVRKLLKSDD